MNVADVKVIELPKFLDDRGNLSFAENYKQIPFEIKRTYWLYDVPGGISRGGHAEINNEELIIAMSGSFEILVDDGKEQKTFTLNRSYYGLYIPKGLWREIKEFSTNALALEFGSIPYDVNDYIRDYEDFKDENGNFSFMKMIAVIGKEGLYGFAGGLFGGGVSKVRYDNYIKSDEYKNAKAKYDS